MLVSNHKEFGKRITNLPEIIVCRRFYSEVVYQQNGLLGNLGKILVLLEIVIQELSFVVDCIEPEEFLQGTQHSCLSIAESAA